MFSKFSLYTKAGLLAILMILAGTSPVCLWASSGQDTAPYLQDQAIDRQMGILDKSWKSIDLVNIYSRFDLPLQVRPGFPPYDQQAERAQDPSVRGIGQNCYRDPQTKKLVCS